MENHMKKTMLFLTLGCMAVGSVNATITEQQFLDCLKQNGAPTTHTVCSLKNRFGQLIPGDKVRTTIQFYPTIGRFLIEIDETNRLKRLSNDQIATLFETARVEFSTLSQSPTVEVWEIRNETEKKFPDGENIITGFVQCSETDAKKCMEAAIKTLVNIHNKLNK
jgi:hypothetical protein